MCYVLGVILLIFQNFSEAVNIFVHNREYGQYACQILTDGVNRPKKGADVGDHPPITPMKSATNVELDGDSWKIYDYIVRHFLGSVSNADFPYNCHFSRSYFFQIFEFLVIT